MKVLLIGALIFLSSCQPGQSGGYSHLTKDNPSYSDILPQIKETTEAAKKQYMKEQNFTLSQPTDQWFRMDLKGVFFKLFFTGRNDKTVQIIILDNPTTKELVVKNIKESY